MRRQPGQTFLTTIHVGGRWPDNATVQGLLRVSANPRLWYLRDYRGPLITIGRTGLIQVTDDRTLARTQCVLVIEGKRVRLEHSHCAANPTTVNGILVRGEPVVLEPGQLIRGGNVRLLVVGPYPPDKPLPIPAENRLVFAELALAWYGSVQPAAAALQVDRKTLTRTLERTATGRALLASRHSIGQEVKKLRRRSRQAGGHLARVPASSTERSHSAKALFFHGG